jgi:hypothetical protein
VAKAESLDAMNTGHAGAFWFESSWSAKLNSMREGSSGSRPPARSWPRDTVNVLMRTVHSNAFLTGIRAPTVASRPSLRREIGCRAVIVG